MNDNISDKDKKAWQTFISSKEKIIDKDFRPQKNFLKIRSIDLHGYSLNQANIVIERFILKAFNDKVNKLIVVTGKGIHSEVEKDPYVSKDLSILKYSVPEFINNNQNLMKIINDITDAAIDDGGSGAFYIYLKKIKNDCLVTYPKSGNTFLRSLLSAYLFTEDGKFKFESLNHISQFPDLKFSKNLESISDELEIVKNYLNIQQKLNSKNISSLKFLKTHSSLNDINGYKFTDLKILGVIYI